MVSEVLRVTSILSFFTYMRGVGVSKIVFTGPESTGKTTAATKYAQEAELPLVAEYARTYLAGKNTGEYRLSDLHKILEGQQKAENAASAKHKLIVCDTDWLTIHIWALEKYGKRMTPPTDLKSRHYILCKPDIPWEPDPLRENQEDRDRLFALYEQTLQQMGLSYDYFVRST